MSIVGATVRTSWINKTMNKTKSPISLQKQIAAMKKHDRESSRLIALVKRFNKENIDPITVREAAKRLRITQQRINTLVEDNYDDLMMNVAIRVGSGVADLELGDQSIEEA